MCHPQKASATLSACHRGACGSVILEHSDMDLCVLADMVPCSNNAAQGLRCGGASVCPRQFGGLYGRNGELTYGLRVVSRRYMQALHNF